jgi:hypothetical protein
VALNYEADDESIWKAGRRLKAAISDRQPYARLPKDLTVIALGVPSVGINIMRRLVLRREVRHPRPHIRAIVDLEQPARFESRITLGDTRDQMGMVRCVVDWRLGEEERRTSRFFAEALDAELRAADLGHLESVHGLKRARRSLWMIWAAICTSSAQPAWRRGPKMAWSIPIAGCLELKIFMWRALRCSPLAGMPIR